MQSDSNTVSDGDFVICACCQGVHAKVDTGVDSAPAFTGLSISIPADVTTGEFVSVGSSYTGVLETNGDRDWVRVDLQAGKSYQIDLFGSGPNAVGDTYLRLYDSSGAFLVSNDDGGVGLNSKLTFSAATTDSFYISAGAYADARTGQYTISVGEVSAPQPSQVWTNDQIADQLKTGYWGGGPFSFDTGPNNQITYDVGKLTAAAQGLARDAFQVWSDAIGVNFVELSAGGQITFDDTQSGAFAQFSNSGSRITSAQINVSTNWTNNYGTSRDSYSFQTFIHEIGHTLGFGHAGNYNGSADYASDRLYANDSWQATIMSYFSQTENTFINATRAFVITPQIADVVAGQSLYGDASGTRTGDTVYGYNSTAGGVWDGFVGYGRSVTATIVDGGGLDTIDFSGSSATQRIDLRAEMVSDVNSDIGNLQIARGTVIENAIGGSGTDTITGNDGDNRIQGNAGSDNLNGGAGGDTYVYAQGDGTDTVEDTSGDDTILIADAALGLDQLAVETSAGETKVRFVDNAQIEINVDRDVSTGVASVETLAFSNGWRFYLPGIANGTLGTASDNTVQGGAGSDFHNARGGNDSIDAAGGADIVVGADGNDTLRGGTGNDMLFGGMGDDVYVLDGGDGFDRITESGGTDRLKLTDVSVTLDNLALAVNPIYDLVIGFYNQPLDGVFVAGAVFGQSATVETLEFADGTTLNLAGISGGVNYDDANNSAGGRGEGDFYNMRGGNDDVQAGAGNDLIIAGAGDDTVDAGDGDDRIYLGTGSDTAFGGVGDDYYVIETGPTRISDVSGQDTLRIADATVSFDTMLMGADAARGFVVAFAGKDLLVTVDDAQQMQIETIEFASGWNIDVSALRGGTNHGSGDDVVIGRDVGDFHGGGAGNDTILSLGGNDLIAGGLGNDVIDGASGYDQISGGAGNDTFVFSGVPGIGDDDLILDFVSGTDRIRLDDVAFGISAVTAANSVLGPVATTAQHRIIYDDTTGQLMFDADGSGAAQAVLIATFVGAPSIALSDFEVL